MVGILVTGPDLVVRSWDAGLARLTGITPAAACGRPVRELLGALQAAAVEAGLRRVLATGATEVLDPAGPGCFGVDGGRRLRMAMGPLTEDERVTGVVITVDGPTVLDTLSADDRRVRRAAAAGLAARADDETAGALLALLREHHRDFGVLSSVLPLLGRLETDVVPALVTLLHGPDAGLRVQAALALATRPDARAAAALLDALHDPDPNVRFHAVEALGRLGVREAAGPLAAIAVGGDFFLAFPALDALAAIGEPAVAPRLVPLLDDDMLRAAAADALGRLGDVRAVPALVGVLDHRDAPVDAVARALASIHERAPESGRDTIAGLVRELVTPGGVTRLCEAARRAGMSGSALALTLGWLAGDAVDRALVRLLAEPQARRTALGALVARGRRVAELLIAQLTADDAGVRQAAAVALGRIGDVAATLPLLPLLDSEPDLAVAALDALGRLGDPRAFEALLAALADERSAVRHAAVAALKRLDHPATAAALAPLFRHARPHVREAAVRIAGHRGHCAEALFAACEDDSEGVRRAAVEALAGLDDPRAEALILGALRAGTPRVRAAAAEALGAARGDVADPLLAALDDADAWVRYFAARALGRRGCEAAVERLARLAREDGALQAAIAAVESLGRIGGERAAAALRHVAGAAGGDVAAAAGRALAELPAAASRSVS